MFEILPYFYISNYSKLIDNLLAVKLNNMIKKDFLFIVTFFTIVGSIHSQNEKTIQLPSVAIGAGILSFKGDVSKGGSTFGGIRGGYNLTAEERIEKYLAISLNGVYGKLSGTQRSKITNLNFQSKVFQGDLSLVLHIGNGLLFKHDSTFSPYLSIGLGFLKFDPYGDLKDASGVKYNYWTDGTIRSIAQSEPNAALATILQRDFTYETKLTDSSSNYKRGTLTLPVGAGVKLKLFDNIDLKLGATYYFTFTDWIDNYKSGSNDKYIFANVSIQYNFTKKENKNSVYAALDFSAIDNLDSDGDGVKDSDDHCQGTPNGVSVDVFGCPIDSDEDGVPDYLDKEPQTKKGAIVNESGETLTKKMIADKQKAYEAETFERSRMFNASPSLEYLKEIESMAAETKKNNSNKKIEIPQALKPADKNNDGFISANEIKDAIDKFFEGDSNFTVEKLNDLIDFFFQQ